MSENNVQSLEDLWNNIIYKIEENMSENNIQAPEKSLKYMSWSIKELVAEFKKINENLEKIIKVLAENKGPF